MSNLLKAINGHPALQERPADWLGLLVATALIVTITTVLSR